VVLSYHLGPLSLQDTIGYVKHRLKVAAEDGCVANFSDEALADVYAATNGIPRLINILCDNALLVGYTREVQCIDKAIVGDVVRDMTCWGLRTSAQVSPTRTPAAAGSE
jgi:type II secretory pathway predicted ATPase ExeA